jgi:hypothetical protein
MRLPRPRGPLSTALLQALRDAGPVPAAGHASSDGDLQLCLWVLYELHYRGFDDVPQEREWDADLIRLRGGLERVFEAQLRRWSAGILRACPTTDVVAGLEEITALPGPPLARYLQRDASAAEFREYLALRSLYHLKEADPHSWVVPRLTGAAKVALAELQYDEYGGGVASRLHQQLYADALREAGLDPTYGAYLDRTPAHVLAVNNVMSLFGLNRRLRGAAMGHLAAFEMTSSVPCRKIAGGAERLGLGDAVVRYYEEHVEADAVHEHLAARSICAALVDDEPALRSDVLLGAAACVLLDARSAERTLSAWQDRGTALLRPSHREAA